jgi:hypothetical protein
MGENRWWLQFAWGDKIEIQIVVVTDETSFTITPVYDFVLGDSGNYKIDTVDATGEFDIPPVAPLDGFGMGKPATSSSVEGSSVDDEEEVSPATAGAESDDAGLIQGEDQADDDDLEEPSEEAISEPSSVEEEQALPPDEESSEEAQEEPFEEELPDEPEEAPSEEDTPGEQGINT